MAETNQVNWRGVHPVYPVENLQVHLGAWEATVADKSRTQVKADGNSSSGNVVIHKVTAGKTFYLCSMLFSAYGTAAVVGKIIIRVRDDTHANLYKLFESSVPVSLAIFGSVPFIMPIVLLASYDIRVSMTNADGWCGVQGWEE